MYYNYVHCSCLFLQITSDLKFVVGGKDVHVHKSILKIR